MTATIESATLSLAEDEQLFANSVYEFADKEISSVKLFRAASVGEVTREAQADQ